MFCKKCGKEITDDTRFCPFCGTDQLISVIHNSSNARNPNVSNKSRTVAALLAFFLGALGIHRFYVGKTGTAVLQILLSCCFGLGYVWALIDLVVILCGNFTDKDGLLITDWDAKY
ncbi:MAG: NINE protein [Treponema sp.]|nr:NINE protein [Treponema sp.]